MVESLKQLGKIEGVNAGNLRNSGQEILEIAARTPRDPGAPGLWHSQELLDSEQKKRLKGVMKLIRETAESMNLAASLLANRSSVEKFIRGNREIDLFRGWRKEVVGEKILQGFN